MQDPSAPFDIQFLDLNPKFKDIREYRVDKIGKGHENQKGVGVLHRVKENGFISKTMKAKQEMLNGLLGDLDKEVIEESVKAIKEKRKHDKDVLR